MSYLLQTRSPHTAALAAAASITLLAASSACAQTPIEKPAGPEEALPLDLINPDRPGTADGSQVIGAHRFQIEAGIERDLNQDGKVTTTNVFFPTLFRVGVDDHWEARLEGGTFNMSRTSDPSAGVSRSSGYSPESLGAKYHFVGSPFLSLGTILRIFPASGTGDFRTDHTTGDVRLVADDTLSEAFSLNPNVGFGSYEDAQGRTYTTGLFACTLNYVTPNQRVNPFIDIGAASSEARGGKASILYDGGIAVIVGMNIQLDASVGTGAAGMTTPHPFVGGGVSVRF